MLALKSGDARFVLRLEVERLVESTSVSSKDTDLVNEDTDSDIEEILELKYENYTYNTFKIISNFVSSFKSIWCTVGSLLAPPFPIVVGPIKILFINVY